MNEVRLIDANALKEEFATWNDLTFVPVMRERILKLIDNAPTVEQPQGEWEEYGEYKLDNHYFKCSACGELEEETSNYCPNCGAKMD